MSEIVERSLKLTVQGEDLTEALFGDLAARLDELQSRAEGVFSAISAAARSSVAEMESAIGEAPAFWMDQLQAVADTAGVAFGEVADSALTAADAVVGSAARLDAPLSSIAASTDAALAKITASFDSTALAVDGDIGKIDDAVAGLTGAFDGAAGSADGFDSRIKGAMDGVVGTVDSDTGKINGSLDKIMGGFDETAGSVDTLDSSMKKALDGAAAVADSDAAKIDAAMGKIQAAVDKVDLSLLPAVYGGKGGGKGGAAGEKSTGSMGLLPLYGGAASEEKAASSWLDKILPSAAEIKLRAKTLVDEVSKAYEKVKSSMEGIGSKTVTGGIVASMLPFGMESGANYIEQIATVQQQTGLTPASAQQLLTAVMGLGVNNPMQVITGLARMQKRLHSATTEIVGLQGSEITGGVNPGSGPAQKRGINPVTLGIGVPNTTIERELAPFGLTPEQLFKMSSEQQLATISEAFKKAPSSAEWKNRETSLIQTLLGGSRGGTGVNWQLVMRDYSEALGAAKGMPNPVAIAGFPKNALSSAISARETGYTVQTSLQMLLVELVPALTGFTKALLTFTEFITHPGSKTAESMLQQLERNPFADIAGVAGGIWGGKKAVGAGKALGKGAKWLSKLFGSGEGAAIAEDTTKMGLHLSPAMLGAQIAAVLTQSSGVDLSNTTASDTSAFAKMWQKLVAPHTSQKNFSQNDSFAAIIQAAKVFGIDPTAMLSAGYAESTLNAKSVGPYVPGQGNARGLFQFMPATWAGDTKRYLGQSIDISYASNPYVNAMLAAASMAHMGIGKMSGETALKNIIGDLPGVTAGGGTGFLHPGKAGAASDLSRATPFLQLLQKDGAANLGKTVDQALEKIVQSATKHGRSFDAETRKMLVEAEKFLKAEKDPFSKTGEDLLKGLEQGLQKELPHLKAEVRKIASELEAELRAATGTHSPSEMFAAIGSDLAAGLLLGYQRKMPEVLAGVGGSLDGLHGAATHGGGPTVVAPVYQISGVGKEVHELADEIHERTMTLVKLQGSTGA